jgi:hypothetical protein
MSGGRARARETRLRGPEALHAMRARYAASVSQKPPRSRRGFWPSAKPQAKATRRAAPRAAASRKRTCFVLGASSGFRRSAKSEPRGWPPRACLSQSKSARSSLHRRAGSPLWRTRASANEPDDGLSRRMRTHHQRRDHERPDEVILLLDGEAPGVLKRISPAKRPKSCNRKRWRANSKRTRGWRAHRTAQSRFLRSSRGATLA